MSQMHSYLEGWKPANGLPANLEQLSYPATPNGQRYKPKLLSEHAVETGTTKPIVLVVDDVEDVMEMLSVLLYRAGFEVITASSALAAIAAAKATRVDLIVYDIAMPKMSGYELAAEMVRLPGYQTVL